SQRRTPGSRGHEADTPASIARSGHQMCARHERARRIHRLEPDQLTAVLAAIAGTHQRATPDEVAGLLLYHWPEAEIERIGRAVRVGADVQKAFLQSQNEPGLEAHRLDAEFGSELHQSFPHLRRRARRYGDLVAQLAGEAHAL